MDGSHVIGTVWKFLYSVWKYQVEVKPARFRAYFGMVAFFSALFYGE